MEITQTLVSKCFSLTELLSKLGTFSNTRNRNKLRNKLIELNINFSHFTLNGSSPAEKMEKICPVCDKIFTVPKNNRKNQTTCSYSCSNTFFARKRNKPENYKNYRTICFFHHKKKCVVCPEDKIVEVHHLDGNEQNNDPKNLVPLCPTHHQYWHSRYRGLIREKVELYVSTKS